MSDEFKSLITKILLVALTSLATKLHLMEGDTAFWGAIASDIADVLVMGYTIYSHRDMKKVPVEATAKVNGVTVSPAGATTVTNPVPAVVLQP